MVLGKFLPPHLGHCYLIEFASRYADRVTVVVGTLEREPIPGALRHRWMKELFPHLEVLHLTDENPQQPEEHPDFWNIWKESLLGILPEPPDLVFASEPYGFPLAEILGAEFVPVDIARGVVPVSGTAIRNDPFAHWRYLPPCVRAHYALRVCVFGPESTGKTTLAARLAEHYRTEWVPEYARGLIEAKRGEITFEDMETIARGQAASEEVIARRANRILFSDTDPLATTIWSHALYGRCSPVVEEHAKRAHDLYLLTDVDVPWVADVARFLPNERASFLARCEEALKERGRPYVLLSGDWDQRFAAAIAAVDELLARGPRS